MSKRKTKEQFIIDSIRKHGNKYDYSLVEYINNRTTIMIICPIHGEFKQTPSNHIQGRGCKKCHILNILMSINTFIQKSNIIHNNKYNYSLVKLEGLQKEIKIICPIHGEFKQKPEYHLYGHGCHLCGGSQKLTLKQFIEKSKKVHGDKYNYSLVEYKNTHTEVNIICKIHGKFKQKAREHYDGCGCPKCKESKGERKIRNYLKFNNIDFKSQKTFEGCKYKNLLKFDFYLPKENLCIEYDGEHHFIIKEHWGGIKEFKNIQKRDNIKIEYCKNNVIKLLRIKYTDNIEEKLNEIIQIKF